MPRPRNLVPAGGKTSWAMTSSGRIAFGPTLFPPRRRRGLPLRLQCRSWWRSLSAAKWLIHFGVRPLALRCDRRWSSSGFSGVKRRDKRLGGAGPSQHHNHASGQPQLRAQLATGARGQRFPRDPGRRWQAPSHFARWRRARGDSKSSRRGSLLSVGYWWRVPFM